MKYLIIGSGRAAKNFISYLTHQKIPFEPWNRNLQQNFDFNNLGRFSHILLLISDSSIESFYKKHLKDFSGPIIHCSGALEIPGLVSVHPLASFTLEPMPPKDFEAINFITTYDGSLEEILPGFKNPLRRIFSYEKAKYHALCVMAGNFSVILWQKIFSEFERMGLPTEAIQPYLKTIFKNIEENPMGALTGPLARQDDITISKNLMALEDDEFQEVYLSFLKVKYPQFFQQKELSQ